MLGFIYLLVGVGFGYAVCETLFPNFCHIGEKTFSGKKLLLPSYYIRIPAWVLSGIIPLTWVTYLTAYVVKVFGGVEYPLATANVISLLLFAAMTALLWWYRAKKGQKTEKEVWGNRRVLLLEAVFFGAILLFFTELMFNTFRVENGQLLVGWAVHSDFAPHLGMIRSFSCGNNFPTQYAHFAGEDIKYHFMFQFLVGNLEFLGMGIDWAFNLLSIFGLVATCTLLYALAAKLTGKRLVGGLTVLFFMFRSSPSFFRFLAETPKEQLTLEYLKNYREFFYYTNKEEWGLWNLKVYCNQRHLAFAIAVMLLALHFFMPYVYEMANKLKEKREALATQPRTCKTVPEWACATGKNCYGYLKAFFFTKTAFWVKHPWRAFFLGVLLGGLSFFNGSVVISCCAMLFFMAAVSDYRLDYLITAVTALVLSVLESKLFITGSAVSVQYFFGFLADNRTVFGVMDYMWRLWGILLLFIAAYLCFGRGVKRYLIFVFSVPLVIAFTVFLIAGIEVSPDNMHNVLWYVSVNHKFVMMSAMLLSIFPAIIIGSLFEKHCTWTKQSACLRRVVAVGLVVLMTLTGVFEYHVTRNVDKNHEHYDLQDPLAVWINQNTDSEDLFLTGPYELSPILLGGGMLYYGHSYYAQSAGYDTDSREATVRQMYGATSPSSLDALVQEYGIDFIVVDSKAKENYTVREYVIAATYEAVYAQGEGDGALTIYDTSKPLGLIK
ncbi:MAG: hypothetical protein IKB07_02190 [Lachnospiraceae bacterium]|nr:hypothetical protein [Lachnospiraceae bacterium]